MRALVLKGANEAPGTFPRCDGCGAATMHGPAYAATGLCFYCRTGSRSHRDNRCWAEGCDRPQARGTLCCQLCLDAGVARFLGAGVKGGR